MNFETELNEKQYEAVSNKSQYLRIIAGAGSGKTRVLTYRIAYLIDELNVNPYEILAITFTNKVAKEMENRTKNLLPNLDLSDLKIKTFHSFCNYFLRREIYLLDFPRHFAILDQDDQERLIKDICLDFGYKKSDDFIDKAINFIQNYKCKGKLPNDVKLIFTQIDKKCLEVFKEYENRKNRQYSLDFDDLLIYTVLILEKFADIKNKYNRRFLHILIDEFQDTNDLQFKLLTLLAGEKTNIYVVGDPDQTIYTWRGANQKVILDMEQYFSPLKTIILNENYRSTKEILSVANELISHNKERIKKDLFTNKDVGKKVIVHSSSDTEEEAKYVIDKILELKSLNNLSFKDFTILYRSAYSSRAFEKKLMERRIPYLIYSGIKFYERKEVKDALAYFQLILNPLDNISFLRICNTPKRGIGEQTILKIKQEANAHQLSLYNYILNIDSFYSELPPRIINLLKELSNEIESTKAKLNESYEAYSEILNDFLVNIGYFDHLAIDEETKDDRIENVHSLIEDIRLYLKNNPESSFDEYLQNITLLTSQDELDSSKNSVSLMTVHTAKGLEFPYVFVVNFNQSSFPNSRSIGLGDPFALEEERRLAYVAFTRAKKELYVTLNSGYSFSANGRAEPSQFIHEAGLNIENSYSFNHQGSNYQTTNLYAFRNKIDDKEIKRENSPKIYPMFEPKNNIKWEVGDLLTHKAFGEGKVIEVKDNIIVVNFNDFGIKKMDGTHKFLSKKGF